MTHKIFNASNVLGVIAFFAMIGVVGAAESGMHITAVVLIGIMATCAYLSIREEGKRK